jgi:hypothetical protein
MNKSYKKIESLTIADLKAHPVWVYVNDDSLGETVVRPIKKLPVQNLDGKEVATQVRLANGQKVWALIGNVDASNPQLTEHFILLTIFWNDKRFTLSRYHDHDYAKYNPDALAHFLEMKVDDVFPITYDLSGVSKGNAEALIGNIYKEPRERLTEEEIIRLAIP